MMQPAAPSPVRDASDGRAAAASRPPPKAVRLLLPLWGQRYVKQFLEFGMPTLLAPGNLPALAKRLPCKLIFLSSAEDAAFLHGHPAYSYLSSVCETDIELIDDLITGDNYSTTITLAYARAVHAAGADMLDTCFFFLISDYLIADGSLSRVLDRMMAGASGVLAGNFQVVAEDAVKTFYKTFDRGTPELVLPAREVMAWALAYLHPMTAANMVNFPLCHSLHSNRLFWRVDENTLIGRFYLMHMICIRPEIADFVIGASCDYSFIPEMCPSGNVTMLTDSDDYLVVEMQPRKHERSFLRIGPPNARQIADDISEWATQRHRENVRSTLVFHAADIPAAVPQVIREADVFVSRVSRELSPKPQPHRNHPYWIGAMAAHRWAIRKRKDDIDDSLDDLVRAGGDNWRGRLTTLIHNCRFWAFGRAPHVLPWHPRWPDYRILQGTMRRLLGGPRSHILVLSANPTVFADWLGGVAEKTTSWHAGRLLDIRASQYEAFAGHFDGCLLFLDMEELELGRTLTRRVQPLLAEGGFLLIEAANGRATSFDDFFNLVVAANADHFLNLSAWIESIEFVATTPLRLAVLRGLRRLNDKTVRRPLAYLPFTVLPAILLAVVGVVCNLFALRGRAKTSRHRLYSSICMVLRPSGTIAPAPQFLPEENPYWRPGRIGDGSDPLDQRAPEPERA